MPTRLDGAVTGANEDAEYANTDAHSLPPVERQEALHKELHAAFLGRKLWDRTYYTLIEGAHSKRARWKDPDDQSGVDFGCVKDLIDIGWSFPKIEEWYSFAPVGEKRYRGQDKSRGHGYLLRTYDKAKKEWDSEDAFRKNLVGPNWKVIGNVFKSTDASNKAYFDVTFEWATVQQTLTSSVRIPSVAFNQPQKLRDVLFGSGVYLDLGQFDTKDGLRGMAARLEDLATTRELPEAASYEGIIRERIAKFVALRMAVHHDVVEAVVWFENGYAYVRTEELHDYLSRLRPIPSPDSTWHVWESLGGSEVVHGGKPCWRAPMESFPEARPPV
jgi:hypothetical protein